MPNDTKLQLVTEKGLTELKARLEYLTTVRKKEVIEAIGTAKSFGDLSENAEYDEAKNEEAKLAIEIDQLKWQIANAKVVTDSDLKTDEVNVGNKVRILNITLNKEMQFYVVGSAESDPLAGRISAESPMGRALLGCKINETVQYETPKGISQIKVLEIAKE
ncbi:transcription elongation factor GreA [Clostridia bacterium]|nr:transcription elongation factor GreA [Clostridia bacterium]